MTTFNHLVNSLRELTTSVWMVGGTVRDSFFHVTSHDIDLEIFEIEPERIVNILNQNNFVFVVAGNDFPVIKVNTDDKGVVDLSFPRRERQTGSSHQDFDVDVDVNMTKMEAAERRDFTMNTLMRNVLTDEVFDGFGGIQDIQERRLVATSDRFSEDPLRVLRGMRFCAKFGLTADTRTRRICMSLFNRFSDISQDRVRNEWVRMMEESKIPSMGMNFLLETQWLDHFPEIADIVLVRQSPKHHPEGDVWNHTLHTMDAMVKICERENITGERRVMLMFAMLLHDVGKAVATQIDDNGNITSHGHDVAGVDIAQRFMERLFVGENQNKTPQIITQVITLVREHMVHLNWSNRRRQARRLMHRLSEGGVSIEDLMLVIEADMSGRPPIPAHIPESAVKMFNLCSEVVANEGEKFQCFVTGRMLIEKLGMRPSPQFGEIIRAATEAQLDGQITDEKSAIKWVSDNIVDS